MKKIAQDVFQIQLLPRNSINAYVIGSVLVDAGIRSSGVKILNGIGNKEIKAHVLTHAHADHQGASAFVCKTLNIPFWCGEEDKTTAVNGLVTSKFPDPDSLISRLQQRYWAGPGYPVEKTLKEGDMVGDFQVLNTPGHSDGHIVFWRESDRVLIAGDVVINMNMLTTIPGLSEPPAIFTKDIITNRQSIKKIASLNPNILCVGHGPPLYDTKQLLDLANQW